MRMTEKTVQWKIGSSRTQEHWAKGLSVNATFVKGEGKRPRKEEKPKETDSVVSATPEDGFWETELGEVRS